MSIDIQTILDIQRLRLVVVGMGLGVEIGGIDRPAEEMAARFAIRRERERDAQTPQRAAAAGQPDPIKLAALDFAARVRVVPHDIVPLASEIDAWLRASPTCPHDCAFDPTKMRMDQPLTAEDAAARLA